jgi:hypothetical protein
VSHVYFLKWPREGRSDVLLMRLHLPASGFSPLLKSCIFRVMTVFFSGYDIYIRTYTHTHTLIINFGIRLLSANDIRIATSRIQRMYVQARNS